MEPVLFLYMFGIFISLSVGQEYVFNWYGRQMFRDRLHFNGPFNFCMSTNLLNEYINETNGKKAGDIVQTSASWLSLGVTLLGQLPSIFAALIYGPLTDRIGRKPVMLVMALAGAISGLLFTLCVHFSSDELVHLLVHSYNADQFSSGRYPGDPDGRVFLHR